MGTQTIIHGRISLKGNFEKSREFIKNLKNDTKYPWIRPEMFSSGANERPYYYEETVIAFGASYKALEDDFTSFIIKFENILRNVEFDTAKIQMETEFYGTYNFFWKSKAEGVKFDDDEKLIETNEWFFGYGHRSSWGSLIEELKEEHIFQIDFQYPVRFDADTASEFMNIVKDLEINETLYIVELSNKFDAILTYGYVHEMFDYGFEIGKGYWIKKLKMIELRQLSIKN